MPHLFMISLAFALALTKLSAASTSEPDTKSTPLNILFIVTDNQAQPAIGTYGNLDVKTPNIDKLAADGVKFQNVFAANGMCSPTRSTLLTGLMPSQHGVHNWLDDHYLTEWPKNWSVVSEFRTLPLTLLNRGYSTAMIGKWHLGQPSQPSSVGFEEWTTFAYGHTLDFWNNTIIEKGGISYQLDDRHIVDFFTEKAVDYISSYDSAKPFFLQLNYDGPYCLPPTNYGPARNRFYAEYAGMEFRSMPREPVNDNILAQLTVPWDDEKWKAACRGQGQSDLNGMLWAMLQIQNDPESYANFLSQNAMVDDGIGKVLAALQAKGLDESTLVVFTSDQGDHFGQHGQWGHTMYFNPTHLYDVAMNVPFILRHTGSLKRGQVSDMMVGQYDIVHTLVDYVGFGDVSFDNSPGTSFVSALKQHQLRQQPQCENEKSFDVDRDVFFEQEETRGIRNRQFSYWKRINSEIGHPELYDVVKDPGQTLNLLTQTEKRAEYSTVVADLDAKLDRFFEEYSDPKYDLWKGGSAKGSVMRPWMFQALWGDDWSTVAEDLPSFTE